MGRLFEFPKTNSGRGEIQQLQQGICETLRFLVENSTSKLQMASFLPEEQYAYG